MLPSGIQLEGPEGFHSHTWLFGRDGQKAGLSGDCDQCLHVAQGKRPRRTRQQLHGPLSPNFRSHRMSLGHRDGWAAAGQVEVLQVPLIPHQLHELPVHLPLEEVKKEN